MPRQKIRIDVARAYAAGTRGKEYRVLVDRIWPRGIKKETLMLDRWWKELAPSTELRRWFNHQPERWNEFQETYSRELDEKINEIDELLAIAAQQPVLLIYAAHDEQHNNAIALRDYLLARSSRINLKRD